MTPASVSGENFHGDFNIEEKSYSWIGGNSESGDRNEVEYWYEGVGQIKNIKEDKIQKFLFKSREQRNKPFGSLEEAFGIDVEPKKIINKKGICDLILEKMYTRAQEEEKTPGVIIPTVSLEFIPYEKLLDKGFVTEENYQTRMVLKEK